jgi:peptide/nickel transport system ATP-binding protein
LTQSLAADSDPPAGDIAPLLDVRELSVAFAQGGVAQSVVERVSFTLAKGEALALVGESGSGKSVTALSLARLLPYPTASHPSGEILFKGKDVLKMSERELRAMRGAAVTMVFQEPMTSLNPLHTIERQIGEIIALHGGRSSSTRAKVIALLGEVGIVDPASRLGAYPHQLSGGQRQRVMIAMALANRPDMFIADEPTTALDVTIQRQILDLIAGLVEEDGMALILISHDLGVIAENVERTLVMYGGALVEEGPTDEVFARPSHPYTQGLFGARPRLGVGRGTKLATIKGTVPELADMPPGCPFAGRCPLTIAACDAALPGPVELSPSHAARCIRLDVALGGS